jgi:hypothetical protein
MVPPTKPAVQTPENTPKAVARRASSTLSACRRRAQLGAHATAEAYCSAHSAVVSFGDEATGTRRYHVSKRQALHCAFGDHGCQRLCYVVRVEVRLRPAVRQDGYKRKRKQSNSQISTTTHLINESSGVIRGVGTQWNDGRHRREREQRLPAVPVGQVADHGRHHQSSQASNLVTTEKPADGECHVRFDEGIW